MFQVVDYAFHLQDSKIHYIFCKIMILLSWVWMNFLCQRLILFMKVLFMKVHVYIWLRMYSTYYNYVLYSLFCHKWHPDASSLSSNSLPESPEFSSWVNDLGLSIADEQTLVNGKCLTATHMSAVNCLLRSQFPSQNGLQDTCVCWNKVANGRPIQIDLCRLFTYLQATGLVYPTNFLL